MDHRGRIGIVGVISASGGSLTNGEVDMNEAGTVSNITGMAGTYTSADSNGRFTITITAPSQMAGSTTAGLHGVQFAIPVPVDGCTGSPFPGEMHQQTGPAGGFSNSSLNGNMVSYYTGVNGGGSGGRAGIGLASANGTGSFTFTGYEDEAGTWSTPNPSTVTCTFSVASNGRTTLSGGAGCGSGAPVFYLTAANTGFMLATSSSVEIGQFEPQTGGPFTDASLSSGTFYMGDLEPVNQGAETGVGVVTLNGSGGYSATADYTSTTGQTADGIDTGTSDGEFRWDLQHLGPSWAHHGHHHFQYEGRGCR